MVPIFFQLIFSHRTAHWWTNQSKALVVAKQINYQLNLPISIFFLIAFWPWYTNASIIPETVKTPEHNNQTLFYTSIQDIYQ